MHLVVGCGLTSQVITEPKGCSNEGGGMVRRGSPCRSVSPASASHSIVSGLRPPHPSYPAASSHRHPWAMRKGNPPKIELGPVEETEDREALIPRCDMGCVELAVRCACCFALWKSLLMCGARTHAPRGGCEYWLDDY
jgi:hypothetical protein